MPILALRQYREKHNLTQQELAAKLGVTYVAISRWESGKRRPRLPQALKIQKKTGIPLALLLGLTKSQIRSAAL